MYKIRKKKYEGTICADAGDRQMPKNKPCDGGSKMHNGFTKFIENSFYKDDAANFFAKKTPVREKPMMRDGAEVLP